MGKTLSPNEIFLDGIEKIEYNLSIDTVLGTLTDRRLRRRMTLCVTLHLEECWRNGCATVSFYVHNVLPVKLTKHDDSVIQDGIKEKLPDPEHKATLVVHTYSKYLHMLISTYPGILPGSLKINYTDLFDRNDVEFTIENLDNDSIQVVLEFMSYLNTPT